MRPRAAVVRVSLLVASFASIAPAAASALQPLAEERSDNLTLVDHVPYEVGSDMQFQRRDGVHLLDGEETPGPRDYLFAGADAFGPRGPVDRPADGVGVQVLDVTDPAAVRRVAGIHCVGYHSDVAVYEDVLVQTIDDPDSNGGCEDRDDPDGIDRPGRAGLRIFDVADPARPRLVRFVDADELDGAGGVHNSTVVPWAGLLYLATNSASTFGFIDLEAPGFPVTTIPMADLAPAGTEARACHDIGLDPARELAFCAAGDRTFIWDVSDPTLPRHVSTIENPAIFFHHGARLAPDGRTLVVNDEFGFALAGFGCLGEGSGGETGALWFYDVADPSAPSLLGSFSTTELDPTKNFCTSHFYNFIPGTELLIVGWYRSGMIVVDYADPSAPTEHAAFRPDGAHFWAAYFWRGALYGNAFEAPVTADGSGGLWVLTLDDVGDRAPAAADEGTSWGRWTAAAPGPEGPRPALPAVEALPATGPLVPAPFAGMVLLGLAAAVGRRRGR